jgi:hypothetical protein
MEVSLVSILTHLSFSALLRQKLHQDSWFFFCSSFKTKQFGLMACFFLFQLWQLKPPSLL